MTGMSQSFFSVNGGFECFNGEKNEGLLLHRVERCVRVQCPCIRVWLGVVGNYGASHRLVHLSVQADKRK